MAKFVPPRLCGIKARKAPIIVLVRRGPGYWSHLIRWHTIADHFEAGQWQHARVFERRADLSPNGEFLIYFASNYNRAARGSATAWTAISRPPYWSAVQFFKQDHSWGGGGLMHDNRQYLLNKTHGEDYPIFAKRLHRDGWQTEQEFTGDRNSRSDLRTLGLPHPSGEVVLVMHAHATSERPLPGRGCYYEQYSLRHSVGRTTPLHDAEWADWDHRGGLVFTRQGQVFAAKPDGLQEQLLYSTLDDLPKTAAPPPSAVAPADLVPYEPPLPRPAQWQPLPQSKQNDRQNDVYENDAAGN